MQRRKFLETLGAACATTTAWGMTEKTPSAKPPNVLWLMTDEQRTDSLGCYGSPWAKTPNLDRLAKEGVVFKDAVTPSPVCQPARVSLLTGMYPNQTGIWWNEGRKEPNAGFQLKKGKSGSVSIRPFAESRRPSTDLQQKEGEPPLLLTEVFHQAGYRSASFGKQHYCTRNKAFQTEGGRTTVDAVGYFAYAPEFDEAEYDVVKYPPEPYAWIFGGRFPLPAERTAEAQVVASAKDWLQSHDRSSPFFLRLSFNAPHTPVSVPEPFDKAVSPDSVTLPPEADPPSPGEAKWIADSLGAKAKSSRLSEEEIRKMRGYYYSQVSFIDRQFGILLDWMKEEGLLENTIVAYVSDHGTHLGDYGLVQKQTFYEPSAKVPYFFWYPQSVAQGVVLNTPVETRSMLPTLLDLAGLPVPESLADTSLADAMRSGEEPEAKPIFSEFTLGSFDIRHDDRLVMVQDGQWKMSLCFAPTQGDGALYYLGNDPYERNNLYGQQQYAETQERLAQLILGHLIE